MPRIDRPHRRTRLVATLVAAAAALTLVTAGPASALPRGVYSVPYSSQLYYHEDGTADVTSFVAPVDFAYWQSYGFPTPMPAPTRFVRQRWSPVIYALTTFDSTVVKKALTPQEWQRAGWPSPQLVPHIVDTGYYTLHASPDIFAELDGYAAKVTLSEWAAAGYPQPDMHSAPYLKLAWSDGIAQLVGDGYEHLSLAEWVASGMSRPWLMPMLPGDSVCQVAGGPTISYRGVTFEGPLTLDQWVAAGQPMPTSAC